MVVCLAPARRDVLEEQVPSQLVEVALVRGDTRIGLPLLHDDGVNFDRRGLDFGEDPLAHSQPSLTA